MEETVRERLSGFHTSSTPCRGMEMTGAELNRMRKCFSVAAVWEGWSEQDQAEISAAIRAALDAGDPEILACWQAWLEDMSGLDRMTVLCRAAEARIKAERKAA